MVNGDGHYLGHPQTLERMETDYVYPQIADRQTPDGWTESGSLDMLERARRRAREILRDHHPVNIDPHIDSKLRSHYNILLPYSLLIGS